jgi:hypothetical protein
LSSVGEINVRGQQTRRIKWRWVLFVGWLLVSGAWVGRVALSYREAVIWHDAFIKGVRATGQTSFTREKCLELYKDIASMQPGCQQRQTQQQWDEQAAKWIAGSDPRRFLGETLFVATWPVLALLVLGLAVGWGVGRLRARRRNADADAASR